MKRISVHKINLKKLTKANKLIQIEILLIVLKKINKNNNNKKNQAFLKRNRIIINNMKRKSYKSQINQIRVKMMKIAKKKKSI